MLGKGVYARWCNETMRIIFVVKFVGVVGEDFGWSVLYAKALLPEVRALMRSE